MTKFTTALAVALAAAFVPSGKGTVCKPDEIALGNVFYKGSFTAQIFTHDCEVIDYKPLGDTHECLDYALGSYVTCSARNTPYLVQIPDVLVQIIPNEPGPIGYTVFYPAPTPEGPVCSNIDFSWCGRRP